MEIILARHGKPNYQQLTWIMPRQMKDWTQLYDQADLSRNLPGQGRRAPCPGG